MTAPKVFISYAREDGAFAKRLYEDLVAAGVQAWWDQECLLPGEQWQYVIEREIEASSRFIGLLSSQSVPKWGAVQWEWKKALEVQTKAPEGHIYLIPVRIDECHVPQSLRNVHWVDLFPNYQIGLRKILSAVGLRPAEASTSSTTRPDAAAPQTIIGRWTQIAPNSDDRVYLHFRDDLTVEMRLRDDQLLSSSESQYMQYSGVWLATGNMVRVMNIVAMHRRKLFDLFVWGVLFFPLRIPKLDVDDFTLRISQTNPYEMEMIGTTLVFKRSPG